MACRAIEQMLKKVEESVETEITLRHVRIFLEKSVFSNLYVLELSFDILINVGKQSKLPVKPATIAMLSVTKNLVFNPAANPNFVFEAFSGWFSDIIQLIPVPTPKPNQLKRTLYHAIIGIFTAILFVKVTPSSVDVIFDGTILLSI